MIKKGLEDIFDEELLNDVINSKIHSTREETIQVYKDLGILDDNYEIGKQSI